MAKWVVCALYSTQTLKTLTSLNQACLVVMGLKLISRKMSKLLHSCFDIGLLQPFFLTYPLLVPESTFQALLEMSCAFTPLCSCTFCSPGLDYPFSSLLAEYIQNPAWMTQGCIPTPRRRANPISFNFPQNLVLDSITYLSVCSEIICLLTCLPSKLELMHQELNNQN